MKIIEISRDAFLSKVLSETASFMDSIRNPDVYVVKEFYLKDKIIALRNEAFANGQASEASWHPLLDNCPDYHRLHDNYYKAHVKQKFHGFYFHNYFKENQDLFNYFKDIFEIKNFLAGYSKSEFMKNIPSDGIIPRINIHHYPVGGGYQSEHIDPSGKHANIQTIVIASQKGIDYTAGGVFARKELNGEKVFLDDFVSPGDLLVLSPGIPHGVESIDPETEYSPATNNGRWIILPLFLMSDHPKENNIKPRQI